MLEKNLITAGCFYLVLAVIFNTIANVFIKYAADRGGHMCNMYFSWYFILGITFFGLNLLLYTKALSYLPLHVGYPFLVGLSAFGITASSFFIFGAAFEYKDILGVILLIIGICILTYK